MAAGSSRSSCTETSRDRELRIAAQADRQHGNVTRAQLLALGLGAEAIQYRLRIRRLHPEHRGVYAVGRPARTALERASAAVLACGPGAVLSHGSALALWDLGPWSDQMHVTVPGCRRRPRIRVHTCGNLLSRDRRTRQRIPVTSPARTLLDCAPSLGPRRLTRAVNDALRAQQLRSGQLRELLARCSNHAGAKRLRPLASDSRNPTRSTFEDDFQGFCQRFGLPRPQVNIRVCGYEVDAYFPSQRVIVELDGWAYHRNRQAFEEDRRRDADTLAAGIATVRITWERLHGDAAREAERLAAILRARP